MVPNQLIEPSLLAFGHIVGLKYGADHEIVQAKESCGRSLWDQIAILNDATAAACGEALYGAGRGISQFVYITISTGVGGGIVLAGKPLTSPNGLAGHIGFMRSPLGNQTCGSQRFGTVESVAGGRTLAAAAAALGHHKLDAKAIFAAHQNGAD